MNKTFFYNRRKSSSFICRELIDSTRIKKTKWVSCKNFIDYLEVQGIAFDDIRWFHSYLMHIQKVRFFPDYAGTYFSFYDNRLFCISQSKFSREYRLDFTSSFNERTIDDVVWRRVAEPQTSLSKLHSSIQILNTEDPSDECQEILYSTGCILA